MVAQALENGSLKQHLVATVLRLRQQQQALFADGGYTPLSVTGEKARHGLAFCRASGKSRLVMVVPRLVYDWIDGDTAFATGQVWGDTVVALPESHSPWKDVFTGRTFAATAALSLAQALADFPFTVLINGDQGSV
jgi:(1->4)-alpha-D-glucan 1-alpha-D-glucosylmutase